MAIIEEVKPQVSPVVRSVSERTAKKDNRVQKRMVKKDLLRMIAEARHVILVDAKIDSKAVDAKDLLILAIHPLDASLLETFIKLTRQFLAMALGIYDKRIPAPWDRDTQPRLSSTIIKPGG